MSSTTTATFPESLARRYRGVCGNKITLYETRHKNNGSNIIDDKNNGAIEYILRDESRCSFTIADLGRLCAALALWATTKLPIFIIFSLVALIFALYNALLSDKSNSLLLIKSVGVHIINKKTIFGALEEYIPWNIINDVFINEVISEQKVLYYLTFIVKEITSNGEERIKLIPLFRDLKPE